MMKRVDYLKIRMELYRAISLLYSQSEYDANKDPSLSKLCLKGGIFLDRLDRYGEERGYFDTNDTALSSKQLK